MEFSRTQRADGGNVVFTNGCFDLLTCAHISLLKWAKSQGDCLIVGLNSDDSIRRLKGSERPICPLDHRAVVVAAIRWVDAVVAFTEDTPAALCEIIEPDVLVKGEDYFGHDLPGAEFCRRVALAPFVEGVSTTHIINKIRSTST